MALLVTILASTKSSRSRGAYSGPIAWTGKFLISCDACSLTGNSLDRTNFVQDILARIALEHYLVHVRREWISSNVIWSYHRELWAENGDSLSRIYAGTGALNTSFTRSGKRTLAG